MFSYCFPILGSIIMLIFPLPHPSCYIMTYFAAPRENTQYLYTMFAQSISLIPIVSLPHISMKET